MSSDPSITVAVVGAINLDQIIRVVRLPDEGETVLAESVSERRGGKGANQAHAAADRAPTALIGCVGEDSIAETMLEDLQSVGVVVDGVAAVAGPSGRALVEVDADGSNRIIVVPGANAELSVDHVVAALDRFSPNVVLTQLESPIDVTEAVATWCHQHRTRFILNPSPTAPLDDSIIAWADPLVVNEIEAQFYADMSSTDPYEIAARLASRSGSAVITRGGDGVLVADGTGVDHIEVGEIVVVDTTGAGDAFAGTLAAELATGRALRTAAREAAATATELVARHR